MPCHKQADSYQSCILKTYWYSWFSRSISDLVDNLMEQIKQFEPDLPWENVLKPSKNKKMVRLS
jgi:hypothetical protein